MRRPGFPSVLWCALAVWLGAALAAPAAHATLMEALDLATLVQRADDVVVARVVSQRSRWRGHRIVTDVQLEAIRSEKGGLARGVAFEVLLEGGAVGEVGMQVAGEAVLEDGERYVLFLRRVAGTRRPVGMAQGALPVSGPTDAPVVSPGGGGLSLVRPDGRGQLVPAAPALEGPMPVDRLLEAVRALAD